MQYARYVLIDKAAELTGYTERAINTKIDSGVWKFGELWTYAPDGRRVVIMEGYHKWVETGQALPPARRRSKSPSPTRESHAA